MDSNVTKLEQEIETFLASFTDPVVSASRVINPLLDVWGAAKEVDDSVAVPVEVLLTALVSRELTTTGELVGMVDEVRAALAAWTMPASV